ncbi:MAG: bifunctional [glutamate--ammonia ligase]-adenylyl-L-tyrosine phosphorylase/[glutamate--ammonia-ligase] adenylyltransferase [Deltaproteobacteria bacterium]|nr:bifunctional [glutamate--ammonia ligase]-adenylyl-L-tyrosine phosphorylase/[glutamate--ammonia-ligase] adenylyltransferase [Deltaproteobacteria bacterium]
MLPAPRIPASLARRAERLEENFARAAGAVGLDLPDPESPVGQTLPLVFAASDFVASQAAAHPEMLTHPALVEDLLVRRPPGKTARRVREALGAAPDAASLKAALRDLRNREMLRIAWRDITGWADLAETMADLSELAEACIQVCLDALHGLREQKDGRPLDGAGRPQRMAVIALGKLGGRELNFSSDVDLVFAYPENGPTGGGKNTAEQFFTALGRDLVQALSEKTGRGLAFRVDLRLRPYGENGPLVMSFAAMEDYFQRHGREWERYAWIKARPVAGDKEQGERLLSALRPFVYRRYLDYGTFESLREMKRMVAAQVREKGMEDDIKLGPGGIREVEFIAQAFQLLRGGVSPELKTPSLFSALSAIADQGLLPAEEVKELASSYAFLRKVENRLQEAADLQTHRLPAAAEDRERLAVSMGYASPEAFEAELSRVRASIQKRFDELFAEPGAKTAPPTAAEEIASVWQDWTSREAAENALSKAGFKNPGRAADLLEIFSGSPRIQHLGPKGRRLLDRVLPLAVAEAGASDAPEELLRRLLDLLEAVSQRSCYLSLILENPQVLSHLVNLCGKSPRIASQITAHPVLLDELLDPAALVTLPDRQGLVDELSRRLARTDPGDLEQQMEEIRIFKQVHTLRCAAGEVTGAIPLMRASDVLTWIAEACVEKALDLAFQHLEKKHGRPVCVLGKKPCGRGFAVAAYGKFGGLELGYDSDLDLVFLHAGVPGEMTDGEKPVYNGTFFSRLGQRVIHILTAHTHTGAAYEADMRLRPSGGGGLLVSHLDAFADYQRTTARTWEHQALVRARPVAGDPAVTYGFLALRREILRQARDRATLAAGVREMRAAMHRELCVKKPGMFDIKQGHGGIVDIEFMAQYLVLAHAADHPALTDWPDNVRILAVAASLSLLDPEDARALREAYLALRARTHELALADKPNLIPDDDLVDHRQKVREM